mmetsp:Transcript_9014/g.15048  ORF Transcript_9014/g.15048 Transcript_9014/m.15048 type:complete len:270 (+) Transcript_9014:70-879(+)|eukprot:CAMPEP_0119014404 /NCGR_PEP_ID=MMETSP1176-20130426/9672_1 /TAXON_ID=265551 /ORGANISM="Synedropsis recta cf, Strain CCMP1620" /LENGTH=269 /DNA_ID=CAMNT_0006967575 /DNA_START=70 /DNA_END=879 /DNA_ORIENTATION=-
MKQGFTPTFNMRIHLIILFLLVVPPAARVAIAQDCDSFQPQGGTGGEEEDTEYMDDNSWYPDPTRPLPTCDLPFTNARGHYTANLAPCVFTFHAAEADGASTIDDFEAATICGDDNAIGHQAREYVRRWADECVGDFNRCYSVERDQHVYLGFVCAKKWKFPEGTTHLSVNCTTDKQHKEKLLEKNERNNDENTYFKQEQRTMHEMEIAATVMAVLVFLLCICCCYAGHRWFVVPYQQSLTHDRRQERVELMPKEDDNDNGTTILAQVV